MINNLFILIKLTWLYKLTIATSCENRVGISQNISPNNMGSQKSIVKKKKEKKRKKEKKKAKDKVSSAFVKVSSALKKLIWLPF